MTSDVFKGLNLSKGLVSTHTHTLRLNTHPIPLCHGAPWVDTGSVSKLATQPSGNAT